MKPRFTIDGGDALETHLTRTCECVAAGVRRVIPNGELQALLLGGGYGRGQGGVLKTASGEKAYNDLEFYVCVRGSEALNRERFRAAFHKLSETLSPAAGIEVEFKISSVQKLQKFPPTMFAYDLAWGHRTLIGDDAKLLERTNIQAENIPLCEATRLLMNRCSGLLFAKEHLQRKPFTADDADFVGRNHAKAQLGFGDAFLTAHEQYHWDCRARNERILKLNPEHSLPWLEEIRRNHSLGMEFKFHPHLPGSSMETLCDRQRELTHFARKIWLWLESKRLTQMFTTAREYVSHDGSKCPETNPFRNFAVNANTFKADVFLSGNPFRYPRERLLNSLALLLWEPKVLTNAELLRRVQSELRTNATAFNELVRAYENLWSRFN